MNKYFLFTSIFDMTISRSSYHVEFMNDANKSNEKIFDLFSYIKRMDDLEVEICQMITNTQINLK